MANGGLDELSMATGVAAPGRGSLPPAAIGADYGTVALTESMANFPSTQPRQEIVRSEDEDGKDVPVLVEDPKDKDESRSREDRMDEHAAGSLAVTLASMPGPGETHGPVNIATAFRPGERPRTLAVGDIPKSPDMVRSQAVAPGGAPTQGAGSNDCLPSTASATLAWTVVEADAANWRPDVQSLTLAGQVNVQPWPLNPSSMTVPNTANPVDGGNINNTAGSTNHWQAAIDDMADYNLANGGAGPNWHSTAASHAHEWAHWNTDYVTDSVGSAAGGNWSQANTDIDAFREAKASSATAADAKTALTGRVGTRLGKWRSDTIARWNAIPDTPGVAGSTGYIAGAAVLATLISAVRAYADSKGWTAPAAPPAPPPRLQPQPRPGRDIPP
jgi:hypothetical protein